MANPQLEDGYTKIANEIMDALCKFRLPGEERQVLDAILRKTYGWNKCEDKISMGQISEMTGLKRPNVARALKGLLSKKITLVIKSDNRGINTLKLNKNYDEWGVIKNDNRYQKREHPVIKTDNKSVIKTDTHKRKKETSTKESIYNKRTDEFILPDYIPKDTWDAYLEVRKKKRAAQTAYALNLIIKELTKINKQTGQDKLEILDQSIKSGWADVYPLKSGGNGNGRNNHSSPGTAGKKTGTARSDGNPYPVDAEY